MTKKDFIVIADVLKTLPVHIRRPLTQIFAESLSKEYPNFNKGTFTSYIETE